MSSTKISPSYPTFEDENGDGVNDDPTGAIAEEEKAEPMDEDDFDLEEIIRELEQELDG